jgi:hypothetical protein
MSENTEAVADVAASTRSKACSFCKEAVHIGATKCHYCQASIEEPPDHGGECPFCKQEIHVEAVRCRYCKSDLAVSVPVNASVNLSTVNARATSAGWSEGGSAAPVGMRLFAARSDETGTGPGGMPIRRYCFRMCEERPAGPIECWWICVWLPDRGPAVAVM